MPRMSRMFHGSFAELARRSHRAPPRLDDIVTAGPVPTSSSDRPGRVALAEDDEDIRLFMELVLERAGFEVVSYANGLDALSAAHDSPADAYVVDRRMPGMDGLELCRRLRANPGTERAAIMVVSAETVDLASASREAGANTYLPKPFTRTDLVAKVEELLGSAG